MSEDNFASMFESQTKASKQRSVRIGETLEAIVVQVGRDALIAKGLDRARLFLGEPKLHTPDADHAPWVPQAQLTLSVN